MRRLLIPFMSTLAALSLLLAAPTFDRVGSAMASPSPTCVCIPSTAAVDAGFQLAGVGRLGPTYPPLPRIGLDSAIVPPSLLKAVAWAESNWHQFGADNLPLLSPDFGYGIMQITTGMAGAFGNATGSLRLKTQARIGGDYLFNIAYGARMLAQNFKAMPGVNNRDPTALENWYYALWAYNGWGWANNPNNPQFSRQGTPATDPSSFPYQERIYYWVQHPPLDASGRALWTPMRVTLPSNSAIGSDPGHLYTASVHHEVPHVYGATYDVPSGLTAMHAGSSVGVHVTVYNASGVPWTPSGSPAYGLMYHWVRPGHQGQSNYDRELHGIDALDGTPVPLSDAVAIASAVRVPVRVTAPSAPGRYVLEWDMWGRTPGWFSYNSVPPGRQDLRVAPAQDTVPPYFDPPAPHYLHGNHAWLVTSTSGPVPAAMTPGQPYSETVLLFNPGSMRWGGGYHLRLLGSSTTTGLPMSSVAHCRTVPVTIDGKAPTRVGNYRYTWRLQAANGQLFGPPLRISFTVGKNAVKAPTAWEFAHRLV